MGIQAPHYGYLYEKANAIHEVVRQSKACYAPVKSAGFQDGNEIKTLKGVSHMKHVKCECIIELPLTR